MFTHQLKDKTKLVRSKDPITSAGPHSLLGKKLLLGAGVLMLLVLVTGVGALIHFYVRSSRIIDARLDGNVFGDPALILAAPSAVQGGQTANARDIATHLRKAGYIEGQNVQAVGSFSLTANRLEIRPGPESF